MRLFRPEVEATLKTLGVITLIGLIVMPIAWGYEQRRQARTWQNIACASRIREVASRAPFVGNVDYNPDDACQMLARLGLRLEYPH